MVALATGAERLATLRKFSTPARLNALSRAVPVGNCVGGTLKDPDLGNGLYLCSVWFMFFAVPVYFRGVYLVSHPLSDKGTLLADKFLLHGKVSLEGVRTAYGKVAVSSLFIQSLLKFLLLAIAFLTLMIVLIQSGCVGRRR